MTTTASRPAPRTAEDWARLDRAHLVHPLQMNVIEDRFVVVGGEGCWVDAADGHRYLDAAGGGLWHSHVGHGNEELARAAYEQTRRLEYFCTYQEYANDRAIELAARLADLAPGGLGRAFLTSGGSEAVESAIKAARMYHARRGEPARTWVLSRSYGFHGSTYGAGTLTGFPLAQADFGPNLPAVSHLSPCYPYRATESGVGGTVDDLVRELEDRLAELGPENVAAMVAEPVMGGGGVLVPPPDYWPRMQEVLRRHGILLVADEVITGFGRTGAMFASPGVGMEPDMVTLAKGITSGYFPLGALLMGDELADTICSGTGYFHGYTYTGHPVGAAVALANIAIIERDGLVARARALGELFERELGPLRGRGSVGDVRVAGAAVALELVADQDSRTPMDFPQVFARTARVRAEHRVIVRPYANNVILSPPLVMSDEEALAATRAVAAVLADDES